MSPSNSPPLPGTGNWLRVYTLTGFGLGKLPAFPGTWASAAVWLAAEAAWLLPGGILAGRVMLGLLGIVFSLATIRWSPVAQGQYSEEDPKCVVSDEIAGQCVALLPAAGQAGALLGFLGFRFFDITKVWPISRLERLPDGYGILADDLAAGVFAAALVVIARVSGTGVIFK